jgi:hypothetical protein
MPATDEIAIVDASVLFTQARDLAMDRDFLDCRWNIERVAFANERLISKRQLRLLVGMRERHSTSCIEGAKRCI